MGNMTTRRIILAAVPDGLPKETDFRLEAIDAPSCPEGGLLVRTQYISVDPYLRGRITGRKTYVDPILVGAPMESGAVGEVVESRAPGYQAGDTVTGMWSWQELVPLGIRGARKVDPSAGPVTAEIGILGTTGLTAYFGLLEICHPKAGETLVVSGAAGAVGMVVGQIGKILGCRVVGIAGTDTKLEYVRSLGFDAALSYRAPDFGAQLASACPKGVDCYFDNVGGSITDTVLPLLNVFGRVSVCGQISMYNSTQVEIGPRPFPLMVVKQIRAEGFIVLRWANRFAEGRKQLAEWMKEGKLQNRETVFEGFENTPKAFLGLFSGENTGKAIVKL